MSLISTHNAGFFSCCNIKLNNIVDYINSHSKIPDNVDSSQQFKLYKKTQSDDITYEYFEHYDNIKDITITYPISYNNGHQFIDYSKLDYNNVIPVVKKYFSPSKNIIHNIEKNKK